MQMSSRTPFRGRLLCNSKSRSNRCGFSFYIKKPDILMSSSPVYLQYYLINDAADATKDCFIRNSVPIFNEIASNPVA